MAASGEPGRSSRIMGGVFVAALLVGAFLLLWSEALRKGLNHDENMYIASGVLLDHGLLPYRDYPYFQMPLLTFVYGLLFLFGDHLLLIARAFSTLCAAAASGVLFALGYSAFSGKPYVARIGAGVVGTALFIASPLTVYTSGLSWNHDLPVLLALLAFAACLLRAGAGSSGWWLPVSGLLTGLAAESRLTFALLTVPILIYVLVDSPTDGKRGTLRGASAFLGGLAVAALPSLALIALDYQRFVFGNLAYHALNVQYWTALGYQRAMDASSKLLYLRDVALEPPTLALLVAMLLAGVIAVLAARVGDRRNLGRGALALSCSAVLLAGGLVPAPTWYQYFYAVLPFLILALLFFAASVPARGLLRLTWAVPLAALVVALLNLNGAYSHTGEVLTPDKWMPNRIHAVGEIVGAAGSTGRILTLSPLYALEGGARIYPPLESGPFAWRVAHLLPPADRGLYGVAGPDELPDLLSGSAPAAVLVGAEPGLDDPLANYARQHGFTSRVLPNGLTLWTAPK